MLAWGMIDYQIIENDDIVIIEPKGPLSEEDFHDLTKDVDAHLARTETLQGILVHAAEFPKWETIGTMIPHVRFVRDHHRSIGKVALAGDGVLSSVIPKLVKHFVGAEVRGFAFAEREKAMAWLKNSE